MSIRARLLFIVLVFAETLACGYFIKSPLAWTVSGTIGLLLCAWLVYTKKVKTGINRTQIFILSPIFLCNFLISCYFTKVSPFHNFATTISSPIIEEILFRGLLIDGITGGKKKQIWLSSLAFGFWHLKNIFVLGPVSIFNQIFFVIIAIGPIFAWLKLRYKSLFPSMLAHTLYNTTNGFGAWTSLFLLIITWFTLLMQSKIHHKK